MKVDSLGSANTKGWDWTNPKSKRGRPARRRGKKQHASEMKWQLRKYQRSVRV